MWRDKDPDTLRLIDFGMSYLCDLGDVPEPMRARGRVVGGTTFLTMARTELWIVGEELGMSEKEVEGVRAETVKGMVAEIKAKAEKELRMPAVMPAPERSKLGVEVEKNKEKKKVGGMEKATKGDRNTLKEGKPGVEVGAQNGDKEKVLEPHIDTAAPVQDVDNRKDNSILEEKVPLTADKACQTTTHSVEEVREPEEVAVEVDVGRNRPARRRCCVVQ